jgi:hypothetical protein
LKKPEKFPDGKPASGPNGGRSGGLSGGPGVCGVTLRKRTAQKVAFLESFVTVGTITHAAASAGVERQRHYEWLEADPDYTVAFEAAQDAAAEVLVREARRRAVEGVDEAIVYQGKIQQDATGQPASVKRFSDILLIFLMKGAMPEVYRDNFHITGSVELDTLVGKLAAGRKRIAASEVQDVVVEAEVVEGIIK